MADVNPNPTDEDIQALIDQAPDAPEPEIVEVDGEGTTAPEAQPEPSGIEALRASLAKAEQDKAAALEAHRAAEERASRFEREAQDHRGRAQSGELQQVNGAIELLEAKRAQSKRDYSLALQAGDFDKAADLQADISEQAAQVVQLRQYKERAEYQARQPQRPPQQRAADPVETLAGQVAASGSPRSAEWIRAHPECATDPVRYNEMLVAHQYALRAGHAADSDGYFSFVENRMGMSQPASTAPAPQPAPRRAPIAAAPVTRDMPSRAPGAPIQVKLTRGQIEAGELMGLTKQEIYAAAAQDARQNRGSVQ